VEENIDRINNSLITYCQHPALVQKTDVCMVRAGISGGPQSKWFWLQYYSLGSLKGPRKTKGAQCTSGGLSARSNCKLSPQVNTNIIWEEEVPFIIIH
jgi:hypothetical protein